MVPVNVYYFVYNFDLIFVFEWIGMGILYLGMVWVVRDYGLLDGLVLAWFLSLLWNVHVSLSLIAKRLYFLDIFERDCA